jgi:pimeloyl-ACP methyl ester carboxylesterase
MARTWITWSLAAAALLLFGAGECPAKDAPALPKGEKASIATDDGLTLVGTWWAAGDPKGPAVVLLPAEGADRGSLLAVVPELLDRRLAVLTLDLRGHGESARQKAGDLAAKAKAGDEALLKATALDVVAAARWLAKTKGRDATKVGVLAVGRSGLVALDAAGRAPAAVRAVVALSPLGKAPGLDGEALAKAVPARTAVLLVAHQDDAAEGADALSAALTAARQAAGGAAASIFRRLETTKPEAAAAEPAYFRGLAALKRVPLLSAYVGGFLARELGVSPHEALLDGDVADESDAAKGGAWTKATPIPTAEGSAFSYRADKRVVFGGTMAKGSKYLQLKIRAFAPGFDYSRLAGGVIDLGELDKHVEAAALLEAPSAQVRVAASSWHDPLNPDEEGKAPPEEDDDAGGMPGMPGMPPGMPKMPPGFGKGGDVASPFHVVFKAAGETFTFEGHIVLPIVKGTKVPKVEMQVGWSDQMPGMPSRIPMGPMASPIDLSGDWTEVPAK